MSKSKTWVEYEAAEGRDRVRVTKVSKVQGWPRVEVWYWCDQTRRPRVGDVLSIYQHHDGKCYVVAPYRAK